jgi:hypothetical protein
VGARGEVGAGQLRGRRRPRQAERSAGVRLLGRRTPRQLHVRAALHLLLERAGGGRLRAAACPRVPAVPARTAGTPVLPRRGQVPGQVRQGLERVLQKSALPNDSLCLLKIELLCIF